MPSPKNHRVLSLYRKFFLSVGKRQWFEKKVLSRPGLVSGKTKLVPKTDKARVWFHVASQGELEVIRSAIEIFSKQDVEIILTHFSQSAEKNIIALKQQIEANSGTVIYSGFSAWEGEWGTLIENLMPDLFVTVKYEAWPELWASLSLNQIPLVIVNAQFRKSLSVAKKVCETLKISLPPIYFFPVQAFDEWNLKKSFDKAVVESIGDPRWDRVYERSLNFDSPAFSRVKQIEKAAQNLPRPWGIFGSLWPSDLKFWAPVLKETPGTLFFSPHRCDEKTLSQIEKELKKLGISCERLSQKKEHFTSKVVLLDEFGFLLESYSIMDWAYVGGGFQSGVHSCIEPAIYGIPLATGVRKIDRFPEIQDLRSTGQLTVLREKNSAKRFVHSLSRLEVNVLRERWKSNLNESKKGATLRLLKNIETILLEQKAKKGPSSKSNAKSEVLR